MVKLEDEINNIKRQVIENRIWIHTIMRLVTKKFRISKKEIEETKKTVGNMPQYKEMRQKLDEIQNKDGEDVKR